MYTPRRQVRLHRLLLMGACVLLQDFTAYIPDIQHQFHLFTYIGKKMAHGHFHTRIGGYLSGPDQTIVCASCKFDGKKNNEKTNLEMVLKQTAMYYVQNKK